MAYKRLEDSLMETKATFTPQASILQAIEEQKEIESEIEKSTEEEKVKLKSYCLNMTAEDKLKYDIFCKTYHISLKDFILSAMEYMKDKVENGQMILTNRCVFKEKII